MTLAELERKSFEIQVAKRKLELVAIEEKNKKRRDEIKNLRLK